MISVKTKTSLLLATSYLLLAGIAVAADVPGVTNNIAPANIDHHAWNDVVGWIDFGPGGGEVEVTDTQLKGYADILQAGFLALDCATVPGDLDICATSDFKVSNDGSGNLSGWAWNDNLGWVSFSGTTVGGSAYGVVINGSTGDFSGWAWNDVVGWISFNCNNVFIGNQCPLAGSDDGRYKVKTSWTSGPDISPPTGGPTSPTGIGPGGGGGSAFDEDTWLISSVFDTRVKGGAALNTVMWLGNQPGGTSVGIQVASSNSDSGPWAYLGPDGKTTSAYEANQGVQFRLNPKDHNNQRYFRYKIYLYWTAGETPEVKDVIVSYSP